MRMAQRVRRYKSVADEQERNPMTSLTNDPSRKGELAAPKRLFGEYNRYAVAPVHTRLSGVQWFVWDAHTDDNGLPAVIRQEDSLEAAIAGLG